MTRHLTERQAQLCKPRLMCLSLSGSLQLLMISDSHNLCHSPEMRSRVPRQSKLSLELLYLPFVPKRLAGPASTGPKTGSKSGARKAVIRELDSQLKNESQATGSCVIWKSEECHWNRWSDPINAGTHAESSSGSVEWRFAKEEGLGTGIGLCRIESSTKFVFAGGD